MIESVEFALISLYKFTLRGTLYEKVSKPALFSYPFLKKFNKYKI